MSSTTSEAPSLRDRVVELRRVPARRLAAHPDNWRTHGADQAAAMDGVLGELGFAGAVIARDLGDGMYQTLDGHLRVKRVDQDAEVPVLVVDLNEDEARKLLATYDRITGMAGVDEAALARLLEGISFESEAVNRMLADAAKTTVPTGNADGVTGSGTGVAGDPVEERWGLLIDCEDEQEQVRAIEWLQQGGFNKFRTLVG